MTDFANKPDKMEYAPSYVNYVSLVPDGDILEILRRQLGETLGLIGTISASRGDYRYAPGKWSTKELIGHIIDAERVFAYRALSFARNDKTPLPGFDQDDYARAASFAAYSLSDLALEFESVRQSTVCLFSNLSEEAWARTGTANDNRVSVRAIAHIIAGHELHHRNVLHSKYLVPQEFGEAVG